MFGEIPRFLNAKDNFKIMTELNLKYQEFIWFNLIHSRDILKKYAITGTWLDIEQHNNWPTCQVHD